MATFQRLVREIRTPLLQLLGRTDRALWRDPTFYKHQARDRAALAAAFIAPGSRVLDLGCGRMLLADALPAGCSYAGVDLVPQHPKVLPCDLNDASQFPHGRYDYVVMLGVLEYLYSPRTVLLNCRQSAERLVVSYNFCKDRHFRSWPRRWRKGYVSNFDEPTFWDILSASGWRAAASRLCKDEQHWRHAIYLCEAI